MNQAIHTDLGNILGREFEGESILCVDKSYGSILPYCLQPAYWESHRAFADSTICKEWRKYEYQSALSDPLSRDKSLLAQMQVSTRQDRAWLSLREYHYGAIWKPQSTVIVGSWMIGRSECTYADDIYGRENIAASSKMRHLANRIDRFLLMSAR